jgi:hypothetical protein
MPYTERAGASRAVAVRQMSLIDMQEALTWCGEVLVELLRSDRAPDGAARVASKAGECMREVRVLSKGYGVLPGAPEDVQDRVLGLVGATRALEAQAALARPPAPPRAALHLLYLAVPRDRLTGRVEWFEETYERNLRDFGVTFARILFWRDVVYEVLTFLWDAVKGVFRFGGPRRPGPPDAA